MTSTRTTKYAPLHQDGAGRMADTLAGAGPRIVFRSPRRRHFGMRKAAHRRDVIFWLTPAAEWHFLSLCRWLNGRASQ